MIDGTSTEDLLALPLGRFCNRVLSWYQARMSRADYEKFTYKLTLPPPNALEKSADWSADGTMASFMQFTEPT